MAHSTSVIPQSTPVLCAPRPVCVPAGSAPSFPWRAGEQRRDPQAHRRFLPSLVSPERMVRSIVVPPTALGGGGSSQPASAWESICRADRTFRWRVDSQVEWLPAMTMPAPAVVSVAMFKGDLP